MEIITPIGDLCQPKSIDEMCYGSVQRILSAAEDKKLYISWSGGIDSTMTLSEFLKYVPQDRIVVMMNNDSIREYTSYYKKYIEGKMETVEVNFHNNSVLTKCIQDGIIITGDCLDPVFGIQHYARIKSDRLMQSIDDFLAPLSSTSKEFYNKLIDACPRELTNVKDLFWWLVYSIDYQFEQLMWITDTDDLILDKNIFHFGMTKDWNDYALSTPAEVKFLGTDLRNYKMPLKQQLYTFTKDSDYTQYKIKFASWNKFRTQEEVFKNKAVYIDTNWKRGWSMFK
jgi:hypothetical protein